MRAAAATTVEVEYKLQGLWRYSVNNAFYAAPLFSLTPPTTGGQRFSGTEQQAQATWTPENA